MSPFDSFPQSKFEVISPEGEVRGQSSGIFTGKMVVVFDAMLTVFTGDEIRRRLPNGSDEAFEVLDPVFMDVGHLDAHYQIKVGRKGAFPHHQGGHFNIVVNGANGRVNVNSTDNSRNVVGDHAVFNEMSEAIRTNVAPEHQPELLRLVEDMRANQGGDGFRESYQRFITSAAAHMAVLAPFLPALSTLL